MLPASRNRTYGTDTSLAPGDMNDLQDAVISRKHGSITREIAPRATLLGSFTAFAQFHQSGAGGQQMLIPLDFLTVGDRLLQLDVRVKGDGVVDCTYELRYYTDVTPGTVLASPTDSNRAAAYGTLNLFTGTSLVPAGSILWLGLTANAANYAISKVIATWDRP